MYQELCLCYQRLECSAKLAECEDMKCSHSAHRRQIVLHAVTELGFVRSYWLYYIHL